MDKTEYERGVTYLVKDPSLGTVLKIKFLDITETSYCFQYENGTRRWITKNEFHLTYKFLERLGSTLIDILINK